MEQETITTVLTAYRFNLGNSEEEEAYKRMNRNLRKGGKMSTYVQPGWKSPASGLIKLETEHLFHNQWNSAPRAGEERGLRVFDWFEVIFPNRNVVEGYFLKITPEMRDLRRRTIKCGWCGNQKLVPFGKDLEGNTFCDKCLDGPHLKETDLHLLRMCPVSEGFKAKRPELTEEEKAYLLPQYVERQTRGADSRAVAKRKKQRAAIESEHDKTTRAAKTKMEGLLWLLDRNMNIGNVIYYSHTDRFCFGWREKVSNAVASKLLDIISEFPFQYEIKGQGQTWTN